MRKAALLAILTLCAACTTNGAGNACGPFRPIYVAKDDALTAETARALLVHNRTGRELCNWGNP